MSPIIINLLFKSLAETLYMLFVSSLLSAVIGIPLGILLVVTEKGKILSCSFCNKPLSFIVNIIRSIPFIILMVAIIPITRMIAGTSIGTNAAIIPLTIASIPYTARLIETSVREIPVGLIEAAKSMGKEIIKKVIIPEALPSMIENITVVIVTLIGTSAMAGTIGGGGLGDLAIRYGYQRFQADVMIVTIIVLIVIVQLVQFAGNYLSRKTNKK